MPKEKTLFDDLEPDEAPKIEIPGMRYIPNYINQRQHDRLLEIVDSNEWLTDLKRRVQHYGYKYDYGHGPLTKLGPLPRWASFLGRKFVEDELVTEVPDQLIVNEYEPGQGISPHVDREDQFGETVISLSLGSQAMMDFLRKGTKEKISLLLEPSSLLMISGEARHEWLHGIVGRLTDEYEKQKLRRTRRVSLTFRKVTPQK